MHIRFVPAAIALQLAIVSGPAIAQSRMEESATRVLQLPIGRKVDSRLYATSTAIRPSVRLTTKLIPTPQAADSHRTRNAIIGGVIGSAVGIGVCTGISSLMNDSANGGFSTCTVKGNLLFGVGGFAVGALVGAAVR